MARSATAALVVGLAAVLAGRGGAVPCSPAFDDLLPEVELRAHLVRYPADDAERAEKKALAKVQRALRIRATTYQRDARTAGLAGRALLDLYPGEAYVEGLVDGVLDGLRTDCGRERDDLVRTAAQLGQGEARDLALAGAAEADLALAIADGAPDLDVEARAGALEAAAKTLRKAFRAALPGVDGRRHRTCGDEMWVVEDGSLLWRADQVTGYFQPASNEFHLEGLRLRRPADRSRLELVVKEVFGPGTYPLEFGSGVWEDVFVQFGIVESGTLTITAIDADEGTAEGTFAFTARGCLFDCSVYEVTGGVFRFRNLSIF